MVFLSRKVLAGVCITLHQKFYTLAAMFLCMRVSITCEMCGHQHQLERQRFTQQEIAIVCHECETPLTAELEIQYVQPEQQVPKAFEGMFA